MIQQQIHPFKMPSKSNYSSDLLGEPSESNVSRSPIQGSGKDEESDQGALCKVLGKKHERQKSQQRALCCHLAPALPGQGSYFLNLGQIWQIALDDYKLRFSVICCFCSKVCSG